MTRELRPGTFQLAHVDVRVVPTRRARGTGRQLTELVLRAAIDAGAASVIGYPHDEAGISLCRPRREDTPPARAPLGAAHRRPRRRQRRRPHNGTAAEAAGYALHRFSGTCPEELLPALIDARTAMDDAPLDAVEYEQGHGHARDGARPGAGRPRGRRRGVHQPRDRARARRRRHQRAARASDQARDRPDRATPPSCPATGGGASGAGCEAANLEAVRRAHPTLRSVYTYNAASNRWMLDINVAMGFRPLPDLRGPPGGDDSADAGIGPVALMG